MLLNGLFYYKSYRITYYKKKDVQNIPIIHDPRSHSRFLSLEFLIFGTPILDSRVVLVLIDVVALPRITLYEMNSHYKNLS